MTNTYLVTGADTGVGKTIASYTLFQVTGQLGLRAVGCKPVASGNEMTTESLRNSDALALQRSSVMAVDCVAINPYTFTEPTSPHTISVDEGRPIQTSVIPAGLHPLEEQADWVLVEDAGGWFTPLLPTLSFSDQVKAEQLLVILVVGVKLGCTSHAILTAQAVQRAGLTPAEWVANDAMPPGKRHAGYMAMLKRALAAPLLGEISWLAEEPEQISAGRYVDLDALSPVSTNR